MKILYAQEPFAETKGPSIFLAGPTPRSKDVLSWRPEALGLLNKSGFEGTVFVPEPRSGSWASDYFAQVEWEEQGLERAACILFWVPRVLKDMPALITNDEWGTWKASGKVVFGAPSWAEKIKYQRYYANKLGVPNFETLEETILAAVQMASS